MIADPKNNALSLYSETPIEEGFTILKFTNEQQERSAGYSQGGQ